MSRFGIVGLGVMGGSFAARLKELGHEVIGFDLDQSAIDKGCAKGILDAGFTDPQGHLASLDALILCLYPTLLEGWISRWQDELDPGTLIMEISGAKKPVVDSLQKILRPDVELVSIHPMCGRESRGIDFSSPRIFDQANFLIVPADHNTSENIEKVRAMAQDLGCRSISTIGVEDHDRMIAFLSQLTHVIAVSLMNTHENSHLVEYTGDSFRDLTRVARINEDMWSELFLLNKEILLDEIDQFADALQYFRRALDQEDSDTMKKLFVQATQRRELFQK